MSKIRWNLISWNPARALPFLDSYGVKPYFTWNVNFTFNIYFSNNVLQRSYPVSLSICSSSYTVFGTHVPKLWELFQYFLVTSPMMGSHFFAEPLTRQRKAGSRSILLLIAYSSNYSGFDSFRYFIGTQYIDPSFHSTCSFHPAVVFLGTLFPFFDLMNPSLTKISLPSDSLSVIFLNIWKWRLTLWAEGSLGHL